MSAVPSSQKRVGCAGILVEDTFCGPMAKMPPEGLLVSVASMPVKVGGCAANVAIDLRKQGFEVDIAGCVGNDAAGTGLLTSFESHGIGGEQMHRTSEVGTSRTVILLIEGEDRRYIHHFGANADFQVSDLKQEWVAQLDLFYLGGLFALPKISIPELTKLFAFCREKGVKTVLDVVIPSGMQVPPLSELEPLLRVTDYFLPNDDEAGVLTGRDTVEDQMAAFLGLGAGTVIITQGEKGAVLGRGDDLWICGSYRLDSVDPSGAGDAFTSGVIASILAERDVPELLRYASAIGASATRAVGTTDGVIRADEAESFVANNPLEIKHRSLRPFAEKS